MRDAREDRTQLVGTRRRSAGTVERGDHDSDPRAYVGVRERVSVAHGARYVYARGLAALPLVFEDPWAARPRARRGGKRAPLHGVAGERRRRDVRGAF